ncbi:HBL/NHE enterotoxin family protein, partial [Escherichia sp. HC-CC]
INYNTKFQNYYDTLVAAVDAKDKATLTKGLTRLSSSINENKAQVDQLVEDLKKDDDLEKKEDPATKENPNEKTELSEEQRSAISASIA